jgi:hypothetical protein
MTTQTIIESLRADECVLVLGPRAATFEGECLQDLLADRFAQRLGVKGGSAAELPHLARKFADTCRDHTEALEKTGALLREFFIEFRDERLPIYDLAAQLPFKFVLNCTPDDLFVQALRQHDKEAQFFSFHFAKPEYNEMVNGQAVNLEQVIADDRPLVYNLLGHYDDPSSLVLTDADRLSFLDVTLQREKNTLPANITYHFLRQPLRRMRKTFVFLGFDFNEWHIRLFMHLLRRTHEHLPHSLSLQRRETLSGDNSAFYEDNFDMMFLPDEPVAFLQNLQNQLRTSAPAPAPARMEMLLLYHPDDEAARTELETYLAGLRRSGLVEIWHEAKVLPGAEFEAEIRQRVAEARIIVPLLSASLLADERLYGYLGDALRRHEAGEAKVVPFLLSPCDVMDTPLFKLNTFYPKPKGRALSQKPDRAETLTNFAGELRGIVERMLNLKIPVTP